MKKIILLTILLFPILNIFSYEKTIEEFYGSNKSPELTKEQQDWLVSIPSIIMKANRNPVDTLTLEIKDEKSIKRWQRMLKNTWGIDNRDDLLNSMSSLEYNGLNSKYQNALDIYKELIDKKTGKENFFNIYHGYLSPVEDVFLIRELSRNTLDYYRKDILAWDIGRITSLVRWGYQADYLTEMESWNILLFVAHKLQTLYTSWEEYGKAYTVGRTLWAYRKSMEKGDRYKEETEDIYEKLISPEGVWSKINWNIELPLPINRDYSGSDYSNISRSVRAAKYDLYTDRDFLTRSYFTMANIYIRQDNQLKAIELYKQGLMYNYREYGIHLKLSELEIENDMFQDAYNRLIYIIELSKDKRVILKSKDLLKKIPTDEIVIEDNNYDKIIYIHEYKYLPDFLYPALEAKIMSKYKVNVKKGRLSWFDDKCEYSDDEVIAQLYNRISSYYKDNDIAFFDKIHSDLSINVENELSFENRKRVVGYYLSKYEEKNIDSALSDYLSKRSPVVNGKLFLEDLNKRNSKLKESGLNIISITNYTVLEDEQTINSISNEDDIILSLTGNIIKNRNIDYITDELFKIIVQFLDN